MTRNLGGQTGGFFGGFAKFCRDNHPFIWKFYGNGLDAGALQVAKDNGVFTVGREVRGDQFDPQEDITAAVARANRYADLVLSRAAQFGALVDAWEFYNEPVINISHPDGTPDLIASERAARSLCAAQVAFSQRLHAQGHKVVAYNLARGNPFYEVFPLLADGLAASDYGGFHAYGTPYYELDAENQTLRYRKLYASIPVRARKPIIFTEHGTDWNGGGFRLPANNLPTPQFFISMDWWLHETAKDDYVFGSCAFVVGTDSARWTTFEIAEDDSLPLFAALVQKDIHVPPNPPLPNPDPNPEPEPIPVPITPAETIATIPFLVKRAIQLDLGPSIYGEYDAHSADGTLYHAWIWQRGGVIVRDGDYGDLANAKLFNPQTGEPMSAPLPWPEGNPTLPPQTRIKTSDLPAEFGIVVESYVPKLGEMFFGLVGAGNFKSGPQVGTQTTMQAANQNGSLSVGYTLTHAYDAANQKSESFPSPAVGVILGPGSYYNAGAPPPDRFYVSKGASPTGAWPAPYPCDIVHAGMPNGQHFEATYTWQLMQG